MEIAKKHYSKLVTKFERRSELYDYLYNLEEPENLKADCFNILSRNKIFILSDVSLQGLYNYIQYSKLTKSYGKKYIDKKMCLDPIFAFEYLCNKFKIKERIIGYNAIHSYYYTKDFEKKIDKLKKILRREYMVITNFNNKLHYIYEFALVIFDKLFTEIVLESINTKIYLKDDELSGPRKELFDEIISDNNLMFKYPNEVIKMILDNITNDQILYFRKVIKNNR